MIEILDVTLPDVPQRSKLAALEPIGLDTPLSESLISYIVRLAAAHCTTIGDMYFEVLRPIADHPADEIGAHCDRHYKAEIHLLNGRGKVAERWVKALDALTCRRDLRYLTMLTWADVLPDKGLMRSHRAWCPQCYTQWQEGKTRMYEPLIWSLSVVKVCPSHNCDLEVSCPNCHKHLPLLSSKFLTGYCSRCNFWLGQTGGRKESAESYGEGPEYQAWAARQAGRLIAEASRLLHPPSRTTFIKAVEANVNNLNNGSLNEFRRFLGVAHRSYLRREIQPFNVQRLFKLNFSLGMNVLDYLTKLGEPNSNFQHEFAWPKQTIYLSNAQLRKCKIREALEGALSEMPPPSLFDLATRIGYKDPPSLIRHEPELCSRINERYKDSLQSRNKEEHYNAIENTLRKAIASDSLTSLTAIAGELGYISTSSIRSMFPELCFALQRRRRHLRYLTTERLRAQLKRTLRAKTPVPLNKLCKRLGYEQDKLRRLLPDLCKKISERYSEYKKSGSALRRKLIKEMDTYPPRSLRRVAERLNVNLSRLYRNYPDLCRQISNRFKVYRADVARQNKLKLRNELIHVVSKLMIEGTVPSQKRVLKLLAGSPTIPYEDFGKMYKEVVASLAEQI